MGVIVAGIDPSLACTGIAVNVAGSGNWFTTRVKTSAAKGLDEELRRIEVAISRTVRAIPADTRLVVIEEPLTRSVDPSHNNRVQVYGGIVRALRRRGVLVARVNPKVRAKAATGNGNSKKADVVAVMRERHGHLVEDDNVADAMVLAELGVRWLGFEPFKATAKQMEAFDAADWPVVDAREIRALREGNEG